MQGTKTVISAKQAPVLLSANYIDRTWLGGQGTIAAIIVGLITGWIYCWFVKKKITIKLPEQVPPAVASSFVVATCIHVLCKVHGYFNDSMDLSYNSDSITRFV